MKKDFELRCRQFEFETWYRWGGHGSRGEGMAPSEPGSQGSVRVGVRPPGSSSLQGPGRAEMLGAPGGLRLPTQLPRGLRAAPLPVWAAGRFIRTAPPPSGWLRGQGGARFRPPGLSVTLWRAEACPGWKHPQPTPAHQSNGVSLLLPNAGNKQEIRMVWWFFSFHTSLVRVLFL